MRNTILKPDERLAMPYGPRHSRAEPVSRLRPSDECRYRGPSLAFVALTRNPHLEPPARFEPTVKRPGDLVL
jgi:hypothetical protein